MKRVLNLDDIQGNIPRAYGRYSFPFARYFFLYIEDGGTRAARKLVDELRARVTTAAPWSDATKPQVTLNVAFTFFGLHMLGLPTRTLQGMPESFVDGMKARAFILGDRDPTKTQQADQEWCANWDPIWRDNKAQKGEDVHIWVGMSAQSVADGIAEPTPELDEQTQWLRDLCAASGGMVKILTTNDQDGTAEYQSANAIFRDIDGVKIPTPREHFGFTDGIGDPVFEGQYPPEKEKSVVIGRGQMDERQGRLAAVGNR
ncbi:hypothetical protein [Qingshengfaniella alkalisoli]|uniref:hypothetical protein n=1 Tax=Qingshengfaniella alkalisoli TaxID=2599296 RepID=UPI001F102169|nr:hypothetical protein [Qingshengfaniella alkalisoli]